MINSFQPIIDEKSTILILGSIPGVPSLQNVEYYGNKNNAFWRIIFTLFEKELTTDYSEKINLLRKQKIAVWDTIKECDREGSLDSAIKNAVPNDINGLLLKYTNIKRIAFNGKAAEKYFKRYNKKVENVEYFVLPSTSPANARMNFSQKLEKWRNAFS